MGTWAAWNESYGVGDAALDSDHRILFDLLAQLHDTVDTGQSRDVVGSVIAVLAEYAGHHFRREEQAMAAAGYPGLDGHRDEHRRMAGQVTAISAGYRAGERDALGSDVLAFLKKWLTEHILVADKSYEPWVGRANGRVELSPQARRDDSQS